ncbi:MAG: hypothetical protein H0W89_07280 [Candidatus Levybacteria bacterium]|nr:hypothetical protein [Candidatus Levybacteria bacterium]
MKSTVIFADKNQHEEEEKDVPLSRPQNASKMTLSRDEYREVIKEAYKEGANDAMKQDKKDPSLSPAQEEGLSEREHGENKEYRNRNLTADQKEGVKEGEKEAAKVEAQKREETKQKLQAIAERHDIEILRAKTVFPFSIFPDTLIIDTTKMTIIRKQMFATEHITTIPIKDVADATVQTALFLATLTVSYMPQASNPMMIKPIEDHITCLKREDAIRAKNIIKGILVAHAEDIDIAKLTPEEIINVIEKFGGSQGVA